MAISTNLLAFYGGWNSFSQSGPYNQLRTCRALSLYKTHNTPYTQAVQSVKCVQGVQGVHDQ